MSIIEIYSTFLLAALISALAWRMGSLSTGGAWAATVVGGLIFALGGWQWAVLLLGFFISSSMLSRTFDRRNKELGERSAKGARRDAIQVLANGGLGALLAVPHALFAEQHWPWIAYAGAMAAVNADTWATELGMLSPQTPRLITSGRKIERGISGGITLQGTVASLAGALLIASLASLFSSLSELFRTLLIIGAAGFAGSLFDSLLGATLQGSYYCSRCTVETEHYPIHSCGHRTTLLRGWKWMSNDGVNLICSVFGASVAIGLWWTI